MNFLLNAIEKIRGRKCEKIVQRIWNELSLSTNVDTGVFKMNIGNFSRIIRELVNIPDIAVALDDTQYHLCTAISDIRNPQLKEDCIRIRLMIIIGFNQLRAILASIQEEPTEDLKKEMVKWLRYMNELHIHSISMLDPQKAIKGKSGITLEQIIEYQGVHVTELHEAIKQIK